MSGIPSQATMADVARRAGVSVSTVSRTLRGLPSVAPGTRARVEEAAGELSFAISRSASSLVTGRTGRVAVLLADLESWFLGATLAGMVPALRDGGLDLLVYSVSDPRERGEFFDRSPARHNADALIVVGFALSPAERARLDGLGMPVVFVGRYTPGYAGVYVDDEEAALCGTRHLLRLGHRRVAFLRTVDDTGFAWRGGDRLAGYLRALDEAGVERDGALVGEVADWQGAGTAAAVGKLLGLEQPPTALVAETDDLAFRLLTALRAANIRVPGHMSVMGFDDHALAGPLDLTTVAQPVRELGRAAAELVREVIVTPGPGPDTDMCPGTGPGRARHVVLPTVLVPRGSTAPPPGSGSTSSTSR